MRQEGGVKDRQITQKQNELDTELREKGTMELEMAEMRQQVQTLEMAMQQQENGKRPNDHRVQELEELLAASEAATGEIRQMLRQSEEVRSIPSRDMRVTDIKLGKGSYGGEQLVV